MRANEILFWGNEILFLGNEKVLRGNEMYFVGTKSVYVLLCHLPGSVKNKYTVIRYINRFPQWPWVLINWINKSSVKRMQKHLPSKSRITNCGELGWLPSLGAPFKQLGVGWGGGRGISMLPMLVLYYSGHIHLSMTSKRMHTCFIGSLWIMYRYTGLKHAHKGRTKWLFNAKFCIIQAILYWDHCFWIGKLVSWDRAFA